MTLTLESLREAMDQMKSAPKIPTSINFASGLDRHCALEAWEAKFKSGSASAFHGVPVKIAPALPANVIMFSYADKMTFFNVETGKSWSIPVSMNFMKPLQLQMKRPL